MIDTPRDLGCQYLERSEPETVWTGIRTRGSRRLSGYSGAYQATDGIWAERVIVSRHPALVSCRAAAPSWLTLILQLYEFEPHPMMPDAPISIAQNSS
jgi:hypothetical protein